jgi:hypothetical protein
MGSHLDLTAAQLAYGLYDLRNLAHLTAAASMLDEATIAFGRLNPELAAAQREFAAARYVHKRSYATGSGTYGTAEWNAVVEAGERLAVLLDQLGDTVIARCKRKAGWGTCNLPLDQDGECRSSLGHTDNPGGES